MAKPKEYLSDWFKEGLKEFGISEQEYQNASLSKKNQIKKMLAEFGHY